MGRLGSGFVAVMVATLVLGVAGAGAGSRATVTTTVLVQVIGQGEVQGSGTSNIDCGRRLGSDHRNCYATYTGDGTGQITLTATPDSGWSFSQGWSGGDCTGLSSCDLDLDGSDYEAVANFGTSLPSTSTLTVTNNGDAAGDGGNVAGGDGEIDCDSGDTDCTWDVTTGSTVTVVETPDSGFVFGGWGGDCGGSSQSCTAVMADDRNVSATFKKPTLTVKVSGNGTVTGGAIACTSAGGSGCSAGENAGADVTLTATPQSGGSFTGWGGACSGKSSTCTVSMTGDKSVTATFSGASASTVALSVSVTGSGTVTGGGISCGGGAVACSVNLAVGTSVTLTAAAAPGSTFTGWGGACSGSAHTCTLTMSVARVVTATFAADQTSGATTSLTVKVAGKGTVSATGGTCSSSGPPKTCAQSYASGTTVELKAVPAPGATFVRWAGACAGTAATCTVTVDATKTVTATFSGATASTTRSILRSRGRPTVGRTKAGYSVTLRFTTNIRGSARIRALRAGRLGTALSFPVAGGTAKIGPFPLLRPGFYSIDLTLGGRMLHWGVCLGRCGEQASRSPFTLTRQPPSAAQTGAAWSLTLHFRSTTEAGMHLRVYRRGRLVRELQFPARAGPVGVGPLLLSPGTYTFRVEATDAVGRTRSLSWLAVLPG